MNITMENFPVFQRMPIASVTNVFNFSITKRLQLRYGTNQFVYSYKHRLSCHCYTGILKVHFLLKFI